MQLLAYGLFFVVCILMGWVQGWSRMQQIPGLMKIVVETLLSFLLSFPWGLRFNSCFL